MSVKNEIIFSLIDERVIDRLLECLFDGKEEIEAEAEKKMEEIIEQIRNVVANKNLSDEEIVDEIKRIFDENGIDID